MLVNVTPILTLLVAIAHADPNPNSPGPGDVFIQGKSCTISWDTDRTGRWKTMDIELMTGNNFDMVSLTPVGTVDGTNPSKNSYSYTCPQVHPHSPIYFYQFSSPSASNKTWTGRFTITGSVKDVVAPSQSTQPDGAKIPWGTGSLVKGYSLAASAGPSTNVSSSASSVSPESTSTSVSHLNVTTTATSSDVSGTSSASATPSTVSITGENSAVVTTLVSNILFQTAAALGLAAYGFTVML